MGLFDNIKKFFSFNNQGFTPSIPRRQLVGNNLPFIGADDKSRYINDYERVKYMYAVISWIAQKAAKVPFVLYEQKNDGTKEQKNVHRLLEIMERPNSYQSRMTFLFQMYGYLLSTGVAYIYKPKLASSGRFTEMHVIPSDFVQPVYERQFEGPSGFIIKNQGITLSPDEVMMINFPSLKFELVGLGEEGHSPAQALRSVLQKTVDIDKADLATIQNGGVNGIISDKSFEGNVSPEQRAIVEKTLMDKAYGSDNRGRWLFTSGDISFIPIGMSPIDLNLYEANTQVLRDICIVYKVPYLIFDQKDNNASYGTAMREARKAAYTDAILPIVENFIDQINALDFSGFQSGRNKLVFDYSTAEIEELQQDMKVQADTLSAQWWKPIGMKQRESGMEVDPQFENVYMIPSGLVRLEDFDFNLEAERIREEFRSLESRFE